MILIYQAKNKINGKSYIGQTSQTLKARIRGHHDKRSKTIFSKALINFKDSDWEWVILNSCETTETANALEKRYISELNSHYTKNGYNQCLGGKTRRGWKHSEETKKRMLGRKSWNKGNVGLATAWNKGMKGWVVSSKKRRDELRKQVSEQMKGNKYAIGNKNSQKMVKCIDTNEIFESAYHARESIDGKFDRSEISSVCRGLRNTAFGLKWKFVNNT